MLQSNTSTSKDSLYNFEVYEYFCVTATEALHILRYKFYPFS